MDALKAAVLLFALAVGPGAACDEACAPGFVFDDTLATCVRVATS